jgi:hypothetical protein
LNSNSPFDIRIKRHILNNLIAVPLHGRYSNVPSLRGLLYPPLTDDHAGEPENH